MNGQVKHFYAFGPFRLDPQERVLLRDGRPVPLTPKAVEILLLLVEKAAHLVDKDDLMKRVWPDTFVEEGNLTKNVFVLRRALGNGDAGQEYIETVPKRGYRFVARVTAVVSNGEDKAIKTEPLPSAVATPAFGPSALARLIPMPAPVEKVSAAGQAEVGKPPLQAVPWRLTTATTSAKPGAATEIAKRWKVIVPAAAAVLAFLVAAYFYLHRTPKLTVKDKIVLADFDNKTGDSLFDDTLKQGLSVQLEQSPFLDLVSDRKVNETLKRMGRQAGERLTPEVTREVCQRTASKAMLIGSIARLGSRYVIGLKAVNCTTGDVLADAQEQAADKEAVLKALDSAAVSLRGKLGESLNSMQKYVTPVEDATTPSLEALKAYSLGRKMFFAKGKTAALPFLKRAVELDPNFAMAYRQMASIYGTLNEPERMAENIRRAYELREKLSERERFYIEADYYQEGTGELEKAVPAYELWQQTYPRDYALYSHLGTIYGGLGNFEKALEAGREDLRLEPNTVDNYELLGFSYMNLNRLDEAEAVYKQAEERKLEGEELLRYRYVLAFLMGDAAQMAQLASTAAGKPGAEDLLLAAQADTEAWYGRMKDARQLIRRAMDTAQHNDATETAADYQAEAALREVESGNREQARADADAAMKLAPNCIVLTRSALALARAGGTAGAEKLAAELDKTFPLNTLVKKYWLPTIRAAVALERKDPNRAVELLQAASGIELGDEGKLLPVYVRGEAYLMLHDSNRAAAEFQKFIDHRGLVGNFPWGALARLGLARAYAMQGDRAKARTAYQDFLTLWKDADPDIPILKQAKAEYARL
jgi:eukaryotic-like serine/threonine-protein kinase